MSLPSWSVRKHVYRYPSLVEDRELRARVRTLAAADQPGALGPRGQVDPVGELGDPEAPSWSFPPASIACTQAASWSSRIAERTVSDSS